MVDTFIQCYNILYILHCETYGLQINMRARYIDCYQIKEFFIIEK